MSRIDYSVSQVVLAGNSNFVLLPPGILNVIASPAITNIDSVTKNTYGYNNRISVYGFVGSDYSTAISLLWSSTALVDANNHVLLGPTGIVASERS